MITNHSGWLYVENVSLDLYTISDDISQIITCRCMTTGADALNFKV